jgi:hypothetical protein
MSKLMLTKKPTRNLAVSVTSWLLSAKASLLLSIGCVDAHGKN